MRTTIVTVVLLALLVPLAIVLLRFNRKRLYILRCARSARHDQLEMIYSSLERLQPEPCCLVLARTNRQTAEQDGLIPIPVPFLKPWAGRVIAVRNDSGVSFEFVDSPALVPRLRGRAYRFVPMPPTSAPDWDDVSMVFCRLVQDHPELKSALVAVCLEYPAELLQHLLSGTETFELDPVDQVQLGGDPAWVQDDECPACDHCGKQMSLILQLPGTLLPGRTVPRGTFYFFGCPDHREHTKTIAQFT